MVYEELRGDIDPFLSYTNQKRKGIGVWHVVDILTIANNDLPAIEDRVKMLRSDISALQFRKHTDERTLYQLNNQIASTNKLLNPYRISCKQKEERQKISTKGKTRCTCNRI